MLRNGLFGLVALLWLGADLRAAPATWRRLALGDYPAEVQRACRRARSRGQELALFGAHAGRLLECRVECGSSCYDVVNYWAFVLRREGTGWRVVHRASERWEEGTFLLPVSLGGRPLLLEEHHSSGRALVPRLAIYGADPKADKLTPLYRASMPGVDPLGSLQQVCGAREEGGKLVVRYVGTGRFRVSGRPALPVVLRAQPACPGRP